jgi:hypothetical protein
MKLFSRQSKFVFLFKLKNESISSGFVSKSFLGVTGEYEFKKPGHDMVSRL